ncbi:T9SS type A sorting domain-containing protein [Flavivirga sp. 57AJ16]|uniref:T9SS type A sorting domain-containing protein n=1 Tax=Flavivirga sp. 57AJ16 TaxID=3025307 RepID=UPI002365624F|nr:T9SS type A sorting domain-containing protein [Flavivirga sp. 57AJ16]MDD7885415.1 T9SS type A sorting domain-containing protein [Flavivirga sp. 57AJ16]
MKKITILFTVLSLAFNAVSGQTIFDWDTAAVDNGDNVSETIDGVTLTVTHSGATFATPVPSGSWGTTDNVFVTGGVFGFNGVLDATSVTFTFSEPVDVVSMLSIDWNNPETDIDYTFTPTGGSNTEVIQTLTGGATFATVDLNWTGVTSFTVTSSGSWMMFDHLEIRPRTFPMTFDWDTAAVDNGDNVSETIDGVTLTVTHSGATFATPVPSGSWGTTDNVFVTGGVFGFNGVLDATSVTFTFSEPVNVVSMLSIDWNNPETDIDYTFTPTGGSNTEVIQTLTGGATFATVDLNWTGVTSFTVTSSGSWMMFDHLQIRRTTVPVTFDWDTAAVDNGDNVSETIDGVTLTVTHSGATFATPVPSGSWGTTDNVFVTGGVFGFNGVLDATSVTFTFSEPVNVVSMLSIDWNNPETDIDYTFTPTGGSNAEVIQTLTGGATFATVDLNWTGVTSFTVTSSGSWMMFDHLSIIVDKAVLSTEDVIIISQRAKVHPNPVGDMVYIKNVSDLKSINIYNSLGQLILQTKQERIDVSNLSRGLYFLQIRSSLGTETKRIIKK